MIAYDNDIEEMTITCDSCGSEETYHGTWSECIAAAKADDWRIFQSGDEWHHFDSLCVELGEANV